MYQKKYGNKIVKEVGKTRFETKGNSSVMLFTGTNRLLNIK